MRPCKKAYIAIRLSEPFFFFLSACFSLLFQIILNNYLLSALVFLFCGCLLIRGLHHDGLADVADAFGSGKRGEEFRKILKDSRIGSFGALALIFYFLFGMTLISRILEINITQKVIGPLWKK